ncbi:major facilitator superfamily domain-containing protein [Penicillium digitatum]|uniref:Major facilitator superfamily domain-containing protein n=1 Tax=Penicillium digitatum TaxID=36651 RepID=A0A7T7BKU6_PENDI|nr:major facilitator superfamily domain-containing protein [Penicillium digitatum]
MARERHHRVPVYLSIGETRQGTPAATTLQPSYGRVYKILSVKRSFLVAVSIFEIGSLICGVAPSSTVLIVGRAIAGIGVAGIFSGALVIISMTVPLEKRPIVFGVNGMVWGIAFIVGPLLGGAFTDGPSWRWCFYINLPVGGVSIAVVLLALRLPRYHTVSGLPILRLLKELDLLGASLLIPAIICLILALQWDGNDHAWRSSHIIGLFVGFGLLTILFAASQIYSVKGSTAMTAGLQVLPFMLATVVSSIVVGALVTTVSYYTPFLISSTALAAIGTGLITLYDVDVSMGKWIGYQIVVGAGIGAGLQIPMTAVQTTLGGAIFIAVGQSVFQNGLIEGIRTYAPDVEARAIISAGATEMRHVLITLGHLNQLDDVIRAYMNGLRDTYRVSLALMVAAFVAACFLEWKSVNKRDERQDEDTTTAS